MLQYVQLDTGMHQYDEGRDILMTCAEEIDLRGKRAACPWGMTDSSFIHICFSYFNDLPRALISL